MQQAVLLFALLLLMCASALENIYYPNNSFRLRTTVSGIAEYRSALTLDWLAAEDTRQRELALAFETEAAPSVQVVASDCISYPKPASGKVARLMLELLKNLEGDEGTIIPDLIQALVRGKLLVETSMLEAEPDLDSLVNTPDVMMGEPHTTFPRILGMVWMAATDPTTVNKNGWCPVKRVAKYLSMTSPTNIARQMRNLDPVIARSRFVVEEFIQHVTPNVYDKHLQLVRTDAALDQSSTPPTYQIQARPKLRHGKKNKSTTDYKILLREITSTTVNDYGGYHHLLVTNPILEDEVKKNAAGLAQLLLYDWSVIALSLVLTIDSGVTW